MEAAVKIENSNGAKEMALMCIGTDKGSWWADPDFGSELWKLRQEGKITSRTAARVQQMILECLSWMKEDGLVSAMECRAEQSGKNKITYRVTLFLPDGNPLSVKDTWDAAG